MRVAVSGIAFCCLLAATLVRPVTPKPDVILKDKFDGIDDSEGVPDAEYSFSMQDLFHWSIENSDEEELKRRAEATPEELEAQQERIQELRELMDKMNNLPDEFDLLQEAIDILNGPDLDPEMQKIALLRIQDLVSPIWVADELPKMGGVEVCFAGLGSPDAETRAAASWALGSALTNNDGVQEAVGARGGVGKLMSAALAEPSDEALTKHLFALGALVRDRGELRAEFGAAAGPALVARLLTSNTTAPRVRLKALLLVRDLALADAAAQGEPVMTYSEELLGAVLGLAGAESLDMAEKALDTVKVVVGAAPGARRTLVAGLHAPAVLAAAAQRLAHLRALELQEGEEEEEMSYIAEVQALLQEVLSLLGVDQADTGHTGPGRSAGGSHLPVAVPQADKEDL